MVTTMIEWGFFVAVIVLMCLRIILGPIKSDTVLGALWWGCKFMLVIAGYMFAASLLALVAYSVR
jgi:multisubunit Na+/H+ antiporter MnhF subunit